MSLHSLIVHIGAPKTATSTLQNAFFPKHPGLYFPGKIVSEEGTGWVTPELTEFMLQLERTNMAFSPDRELASRLVEEITTAADGRPVVISSEDLCLFTGVDSFTKLDRIRDVFGVTGDIRVILAVRDQVSLLKSVYLTEHRGEMLHIPGTQQNWYPDFDQYLDIHFRYAWSSTLECLRFAAMIDRYEALLKPENVLVYAFEDFKRDPVDVLKRICAFIGINPDDPCLTPAASTRENVHYSGRAYRIVALRQRLTGGKGFGGLVPAALKKALQRWIDTGKSFDISPSPDAVHRIQDYYRADNAALLAKHGIEL